MVATVVLGVGWVKVVGLPLLALPPSPQRPSSRVSKNPNTEKSPCVMVARAAVDHSVASAATAATKSPRHPAARSEPKVLAVMKLLLPPGSLLLTVIRCRSDTLFFYLRLFFVWRAKTR